MHCVNVIVIFRGKRLLTIDLKSFILSFVSGAGWLTNVPEGWSHKGFGVNDRENSFEKVLAETE